MYKSLEASWALYKPLGRLIWSILWTNENEEKKKSVSEQKEEKNKETKKKVKKEEWKQMFNELLGSFFNVHRNYIPSSHIHMKYKKSRK